MYYFLSFIFVYIIFAGFVFVGLNEVVDRIINEGEEVLGMKARNVFLLVLTAWWPLTVLGFGIGWYAAKYFTEEKGRLDHMIHQMSKDYDGALVSKDDWRTFLQDKVRKMPKKVLYKLNLFGVISLPMSDEDVTRIVSDELADRDLFGIKR